MKLCQYIFHENVFKELWQMPGILPVSKKCHMQAEITGLFRRIFQLSDRTFRL